MKSISCHEVINNKRRYWRVIVPKDLSGGKRKRLYFPREKDALDKVAELKADRERVAAGFHHLDPKSQAVLLIQVDRVNGDVNQIVSAVDSWLKTPQNGPAKTISEVVDECLEAKENAGVRQRYLSSLKCSLKSFTVGSGAETVRDVAVNTIEEWLNGNDWSAGTRRGYLTDVRTLFSFALERGYVASNPAKLIKKPKVDLPPPGIHTVEQVKLLLALALKHDRALIGYIAPLYFGGFRPEECAQFHKKLAHKDFLEITAEISKKRSRRFIPINDTLRAWLSVRGVKYGPVNLVRRMRALRKLASKSKPFPWPHDVLRHSFCSYGIGKFGAKDVAAWAAHSEQILFSRYREIVRPEEVKKFWALRP